jgi:hypothetical protein
MHSGRGDGPSRPPGYPIRKPPDHSLAAGSPGNIAGSSVLPRLLVPRHPPCALKNLAHKLTHTQRNPPPRKEKGAPGTRCSRPLCSSQETDSNPGHHPRQETAAAACIEKTPVSSGPNSVPGAQPPPPPFRDPANGEAYYTGGSRKGSRIAGAPLDSMDADGNTRPAPRLMLLRKEVIQPHLPVRLPCYDFVPIADPTFDSSLPIRG